jgi:hypothetical protein
MRQGGFGFENFFADLAAMMRWAGMSMSSQMPLCKVIHTFWAQKYYRKNCVQNLAKTTR